MMKRLNVNYNVLYSAACKGDLDAIRNAIEEGGVNINGQNDFSETLLHGAASHGKLDIVRYLINAGADIHCQDQFSYTLLHQAAQNGHLDTVQYLVTTGIDVNVKSQLGNTVLYQAFRKGHFKVSQYLVRQGASLSRRFIEQVIDNLNQGDDCELLRDVIVAGGSTVDPKLIIYQPVMVDNGKGEMMLAQIIQQIIEEEGLTIDPKAVEKERLIEIAGTWYQKQRVDRLDAISNPDLRTEMKAMRDNLVTYFQAILTPLVRQKQPKYKAYTYHLLAQLLRIIGPVAKLAVISPLNHLDEGNTFEALGQLLLVNDEAEVLHQKMDQNMLRVPLHPPEVSCTAFDALEQDDQTQLQCMRRIKYLPFELIWMISDERKYSLLSQITKQYGVVDGLSERLLGACESQPKHFQQFVDGRFRQDRLVPITGSISGRLAFSPSN